MSADRTLVSVQICDANGEVIQNSASSKEIPDYDDFEKKGFAAAFDELESAMLETSKKALTDTAEKYISDGSKKVLKRTRKTRR